MTPAEKVGVAIDNITTLIVDLTADPKPDYSVNGQSISWGNYLDMLTRQLTAMQTAQQGLAGPYQKITRIRP
jgi:hypothetical protein